MSYRQELRDNRTGFMADLNAKYGRLPAEVEKRYLQKIMAIQNSTRGKFGELMGEISLTAQGQAREKDIQRDQMCFATPLGMRRIDVWDRKTRRAVEVKSGYTCLSKFVRAQISKDVYLRDNGDIDHILWHLLQHGSKPLLAHLAQNNISVVSGYPDFATLPAKMITEIKQSRSVTKGEMV